MHIHCFISSPAGTQGTLPFCDGQESLVCHRVHLYGHSHLQKLGDFLMSSSTACFSARIMQILVKMLMNLPFLPPCLLERWLN